MANAFTENSSPTFSSSSDPRVDFFFHITEDADNDKTIDLLSKSWTCDALDSLKLVAFLRDCRNGKGIRRQYQMSLLWLYQNHFNTLYNNLEQLVAFGYWKDLMLLLMVLLFDGLIPQYLAKDDSVKTRVKRGKKEKGKDKFPIYDRLILRSLKIERKQRIKDEKLAKEMAKALDAKEEPKVEDKDQKEEVVVDDNESNGNVLHLVRNRLEQLQENRRQFAQKRYESDERYRKIYDKIVEVFAKQLKIDIEKMSKDIKSISLVGKWAPSNGRHFDKYLMISKVICIELCKLLQKQELVEDETQLMTYYQKEVCAPLRKYLKIPEVYMSAQMWSQIEYNRVASKCMQKNKSAFIKHDKERFEQYLASKKTIAGATLKPIELVERGLQLLHRKLVSDEELENEVLEKQWLSLCEDIKKKGGGLLDNAIAICDVSGSMNGTPMNAAIGLTILVMELSSPPWNSLCMTFSEEPEFHNVNPEDKFVDKLQSIQGMKWGYNTNFNAVFKLILENAVKHRLTAEQMPQLILVFTDMEFDSAFPGTDLTNFEAAKKMFDNIGYKLPPIAFWNLRSNTGLTSTPVEVNEMGTFLLSGYSGQQLSIIMKNKDFTKLTPISMMRQAIDNERYNTLKIYD